MECLDSFGAVRSAGDGTGAIELWCLYDESWIRVELDSLVLWDEDGRIKALTRDEMSKAHIETGGSGPDEATGTLWRALMMAGLAGLSVLIVHLLG